MPFDPVLGPIGLFVLYGAPGLGVAAALFPEKFTRRAGWEELVEMAVLAVVGSVAVTILLGSVLAATPAGFSASWSSPALLLGDAVIAVAGGALGVARRVIAPTVPPSSEDPEAANAWPTLRSLESMAQEERHLRRALRRRENDAAERSALESRLTALQAERDSVRRAREAELAS
jgi:hypothetical protein